MSGPDGLEELEGLVARFDVDDPGFIADPYPVFRELRDATPIFWNERTNQWVLTRFAEISETLRDRRLGRDVRAPLLTRRVRASRS